MGGDDHLPAAFTRDLADQVVNLLLQNDMLMRVGFVEQDHRGGPRIQKGHQEEHLERSAPDIGKVERPTEIRLPVLAQDVRLDRCVHGPEKLDPEQFPDMPRKRLPTCVVAALGDLQQQIPQNFPRTPLADKQVLHAPVAPRPRRARFPKGGEHARYRGVLPPPAESSRWLTLSRSFASLGRA